MRAACRWSSGTYAAPLTQGLEASQQIPPLASRRNRAVGVLDSDFGLTSEFDNARPKQESSIQSLFY